jgi:hypothetical protein
MGVKEQKRGAE